MRLHIGIFGRRNVGKSSLLNAITRQEVSIVSDFAGTTTDPVEKPMELLPLGPVLFIDTAGIDDVGALGELRAKRTMQVFDRTDLGVLVTEAGAWGAYEDGILDEFQQRETPVVVVFNKIDLHERPAPVARLQELKLTPVLHGGAASGAACSTSARRCSTRRPPTSSTTRRSSATSSAPASSPSSSCPSTRRRRAAA